MVKYWNSEVVLGEIPDEISLAINLTNCPNRCEGCHSSYLQNDIGVRLVYYEVKRLIAKNLGVSCILFTGGDSDPKSIEELATRIKQDYSLKIAWYSGRDVLPDDLKVKEFDYIKLGPYIKEKGPLNSRTTNQRLYKNPGSEDFTKWIDITNKFWR